MVAILSNRGGSNVAAIMPKISATVAERTLAGSTKIDLGTAENTLMREELRILCQDSIVDNLKSEHFSYPKGFAGDPYLLEAHAKFFNTYFNPHVPVISAHIATAPGAASCLSSILYNICDPGDGILVPGPYWNGFDFQFRARNSVVPIVVNVPQFDETFTMSLISALNDAFDTATCPIKGLVLSNPHNPFGQCYPRDVLEASLRFCQERDIHYISDEVYALSSFYNPELPNADPFISAMELDTAALGCDLSRVHTIWSISKDFGASGIRMGVTVSQGNNEMVVGLALAANTETSSLASIFTTALLTSDNLPQLIALNSSRLEEAYMLMISFFKNNGIKYIPVTAGIYVFAKLAPHAKTWEDESSLVQKLKNAGVVVSNGRAYHGIEEEKGWCRLTFSLPAEQMQEAFKRISIGLGLALDGIDFQCSSL